MLHDLHWYNARGSKWTLVAAVNDNYQNNKPQSLL